MFREIIIQQLDSLLMFQCPTYFDSFISSAPYFLNPESIHLFCIRFPWVLSAQQVHRFSFFKKSFPFAQGFNLLTSSYSMLMTELFVTGL